MTTFKVDESQPPDRWVVEILGMIDDQHGLREEWSPDVELHVHGVGMTAAIRRELLSFGPFEVEERDYGFRARRRPADLLPDS